MKRRQQSNGVTIKEFSNGFRLVYQNPEHNLPISHIHLFVHAGSANEDAKTRGASHFIEHMCFKGTKLHPTSQDIVRPFDNNGAFFNAHTVKQFTCYDIKCADANAADLIGVLSDAMFHSVFDHTEYKKELAVVIEENIKDEVEYETKTVDALESAVFEGTVYEHPIDTLKYHKTTQRNAETLKYDDVLEFYHRFYVPSNMLLSITTNIPIENLTRMLKTTEFGRSTHNASSVAASTSAACSTAHWSMLSERREPYLKVERVPRIDSANMAIGFRVCSFMHPDAIVLHVLENVLGGRMTARVFDILREKNGLTYSSDVDTIHYEPAGVFYVFAISDSNKLIHNGLSHGKRTNKGVIPLLVDLFRDLFVHGVTETELEETRMYLKRKTTLDMEDADTIAYTNGKRVLLRNLKTATPYQELYAKYYSKVTREDIHRVIRTYFKRSNSYLAMVGGGLPKDAVLKHWMDQLSE